MADTGWVKKRYQDEDKIVNNEAKGLVDDIGDFLKWVRKEDCVNVEIEI